VALGGKKLYVLTLRNGKHKKIEEYGTISDFLEKKR
jgi:hypothetical protein